MEYKKSDWKKCFNFSLVLVKKKLNLNGSNCGFLVNILNYFVLWLMS